MIYSGAKTAFYLPVVRETEQKSAELNICFIMQYIFHIGSHVI